MTGPDSSGLVRGDLGIIDIDHLMIRVARLEEAVGRFRAMGFTVAPPRRAREAGEAAAPQRPYDNRFILFQPFPGRSDVANFLALACLQDQFGAPWELRKQMSLLWDTEGPKSIVCYSPDLNATYKAMLEAGLEVNLSPVAGEEVGWMDEESGEWLPLRNRPCAPTFRQVPFMFNAYTSDTLESFRHEPFTRHANTARYLTAITGVTDEIHRDVALMRNWAFGADAVWLDSETAIIRVRDIALRVVTPKGFQSLYPGLDFSHERILPALVGATIAVADVASLLDTLSTNGVRYIRPDENRVVIPRDEACNTVLEFTS